MRTNLCDFHRFFFFSFTTQCLFYIIVLFRAEPRNLTSPMLKSRRVVGDPSTAVGMTEEVPLLRLRLSRWSGRSRNGDCGRAKGEEVDVAVDLVGFDSYDAVFNSYCFFLSVFFVDDEMLFDDGDEIFMLRKNVKDAFFVERGEGVNIILKQHLLPVADYEANGSGVENIPSGRKGWVSLTGRGSWLGWDGWVWHDINSNFKLQN